MLKFKTWTLYWSITALYVIPALVLALGALITSKRVQRELLEAVQILVDWRYDICREFHLVRSRSYIGDAEI